MRTILVAGLLLLMSVLASACGSDSDGGGGGEEEELRVFWMYTGPPDDGGYNVEMRVSQEAMDEVEGVTTSDVFEVPYSQRATQIAEQAIAQGNDVIIETLGLGKLITDACDPNPQVYCFPITDTAKQADNSRSYAAQDWDLNYVAGVAAGLLTKTDTLGFNGSFDIPLIRSAVNSYLLGCQSVNPECTVRVIYNNSYFDPAKEAQAARSLIDSGADVLRNWVDSTALCTVAEEEGVYAVGEFTDFSEVCPESIALSTVWDFTDYFTEQAEQINAGEWEGGEIDLIEVGDGEGQPHITDYADWVPEEVRQQTDEVWGKLVEGEDLIVGPIYDDKGKLQFQKGEVPDGLFLLGGWDWYVEGVIGG